MYSSLISALFLVSSVLATFTPPSNPTNTNNPANNQVASTNPVGTTNPAGNTPAGTTNPAGTITNAGPAVNSTDPLANLTVVHSACPSLYLAFSERDIAELSEVNLTSADLNNLNTTKEAVFCMDKNVSVICSIGSCSGPFPICGGCSEYTLDSTGKGNLSSISIDNVSCDDNYNFNSTTPNDTPYLCGTSKNKEYSCKSCHDFRSCGQCYSTDQIPNA